MRNNDARGYIDVLQGIKSITGNKVAIARYNCKIQRQNWKKTKVTTR